MKESYIPQDTPTICTNMLFPTPNFIGVEEDRKMLKKSFKGSVSLPLLNIDDKKLKCSFICKMPIKKFVGLSMKCLGMIVVGVVIIVATGGAGALVIAALAVASIGYVGGIAWAAYSTYHACDQTLEPDSKWLLYHRTVSIEGKRALLNRSIMICPNGGVLNLIINPAIAKAAAWRICFWNVNELGVHFYSQYLYGAIEAAMSKGGNPVSAVISIGMYIWGEDGTSTVPEYAEEALLEEEQKQKEEKSLGGIIGGEVVDEGIGALAGAGGGVLDNMLEKTPIKDIFNSSGLKDMAKGALIGLGISLFDKYLVNSLEEFLHNQSVKVERSFNKKDKNNHIGIYAEKNS